MCSLETGLPKSSSGALDGSEVGTRKGSGLLFPFPPSQADKGQLIACGHSRAGRGRGVCLGGGHPLISCSGWAVRSWLWWPEAGLDSSC